MVYYPKSTAIGIPLYFLQKRLDFFLENSDMAAHRSQDSNPLELDTAPYYTQTSHKLWPNLAPVDKGSKKLVMDKVSWDFSKDLIRLVGIHLPPIAPFTRTTLSCERIMVSGEW